MLSGARPGALGPEPMCRLCPVRRAIASDVNPDRAGGPTGGRHCLRPGAGPERGDFVRLIAEGLTITPEVVAAVWHKGCETSDGDPAGDAGRPLPPWRPLATDLQALDQNLGSKP